MRAQRDLWDPALLGPRVSAAALAVFVAVCAAFAAAFAAFAAAAAFGPPTVEKPTLAAFDLPKCLYCFSCLCCFCCCFSCMCCCCCCFRCFFFCFCCWLCGLLLLLFFLFLLALFCFFCCLSCFCCRFLGRRPLKKLAMAFLATTYFGHDLLWPGQLWPGPGQLW